MSSRNHLGRSNPRNERVSLWFLSSSMGESPIATSGAGTSEDDIIDAGRCTRSSDCPTHIERSSSFCGRAPDLIAERLCHEIEIVSAKFVTLLIDDRSDDDA